VATAGAWIISTRCRSRIVRAPSAAIDWRSAPTRFSEPSVAWAGPSRIRSSEPIVPTLILVPRGSVGDGAAIPQFVPRPGASSARASDDASRLAPGDGQVLVWRALGMAAAGMEEPARAMLAEATAANPRWPEFLRRFAASEAQPELAEAARLLGWG
jgi:hypothetical protein